MLERRGKRIYCYIALRAGDRVLRIYAGAGEAARAAARQDEAWRRARQAERDRRRQADAAVDGRLAPLDRLRGALRLVASAALQRAGFRQHNRGAWRLRREGHHANRG